MEQKLYQVDAFTSEIFAGNPAAVCPLEKWLDDEAMQNIAMENNLAETAFFVRQGAGYGIRWFTPTVEVDLCGHATLASAFVLFNHEGYEGDTVHFHSPRSGPLSVKKNGAMLTLDFPTDTVEPIELSQSLLGGFDLKPQKALKGKTDYLLVYASEDEVKNLVPDFNGIAKIGGRGVIVTAKGQETDFVSRFFAPQSGINEDPVTGSAHTTLTPYWAEVLGKRSLTARQLSRRSGYLECQLMGERVEISGVCRLYLSGEIFV